jgi:hypothetical protein
MNSRNVVNYFSFSATLNLVPNPICFCGGNRRNQALIMEAKLAAKLREITDLLEQPHGSWGPPSIGL